MLLGETEVSIYDGSFEEWAAIPSLALSGGSLVGCRGVVLDTSGDRIAAALGGKNAAILQNHGILTLGKSVEGAVSRYVSLENACQMQLLAEAAGTVKLIRCRVGQSQRS